MILPELYELFCVGFGNVVVTQYGVIFKTFIVNVWSVTIPLFVDLNIMSNDPTYNVLPVILQYPI